MLLFKLNEEKYKKAAELKSESDVELIGNGKLKIRTEIPANSVVFYEIEPTD